MYSTVLLALDGSQAAAAAIPPALELAKALVAQLVLLRVVPTQGDSEDAGQRDHDSQRLQAEGYLESLKRSLGAKGVQIGLQVRRGDPASLILEAAGSFDQSLLVITTFGRTPPEKEGELGRVAQEILRAAAGPVVLVRPDLDRHRSEEMRV